MRVYRLSRSKYKDKLSGFGASVTGQRWNSKGTEVVYTAQTRALANSEVAVHIALGLLPKDYFMVEIEIPDWIEIYEPPFESLPDSRNAIPHRPQSQLTGDRFISKGKYAVIKLPSVVVKGEYNYLLNPKHKDFKHIKIIATEPFPFNPRYFGG